LEILDFLTRYTRDHANVRMQIVYGHAHGDHSDVHLQIIHGHTHEDHTDVHLQIVHGRMPDVVLIYLTR
jgi:hypothetical protein